MVAQGLSAELGDSLAHLARGAFDAGYAAVIATATVMLLGTAALVLVNRLRGNAAASAR